VSEDFGARYDVDTRKVVQVGSYERVHLVMLVVQTYEDDRESDQRRQSCEEGGIIER